MAYRWLVLPVFLVSLLGACSAETSSGPPFGTGGGGGTGATGGSGGVWIPACNTSALCAACPDDAELCESDGDCQIGHQCLESGCSTLEGEVLKVCKLAPAGFCVTDEQCAEGRECIELPDEGMRCVKTTPGCDSTFDCVLGFSCEGGTCVDRRVPCLLDVDCPMSHICHRFDTSRFCLRVHQTCEQEFDCAELAPRCEDIDDDGTKECAGAFDPNQPSPEACVNEMCGGATPVCELSGAGTITSCGQYGLCKGPEECAQGFDCVELWPDGRKECVPTGGTCTSITDCMPRQVCASARTGGPPTCQAGAEL